MSRPSSTESAESRASSGAARRTLDECGAPDDWFWSKRLPTAKALGPLATQYAALSAAATATSGFSTFDDGEAYTWALSGVTIAPGASGFDLNGDGSVDNKAGQLATLLGGFGFDANAANPGETYPAEWVAIEEPDPLTDTVRAEAQSKGAAEYMKKARAR